MHIYSFKLNGKLLTKILFVIIGLIVAGYFFYSAYLIYSNSFKVNDNQKTEDVINITPENYTNVLKTVHENLDSHVGKTICFTGYVYRMNDFSNNQFVLARDMIISSDMQTLVVGFLCDCNKIKSYKNNTWVEITGTITKGDYHGCMPVIKIKSIKKVDKPNDNIYVFPPDDTFVPTSSII